MNYSKRFASKIALQEMYMEPPLYVRPQLQWHSVLHAMQYQAEPHMKCGKIIRDIFWGP